MINIYKYFVCISLLGVAGVTYGQSIQDLERLKSQYERFQKEQLVPESQELQLQERESKSALSRRAVVTPYDPKSKEPPELVEGSSYFGYDFFTKRDSVSFWEDLPTPANYFLGPGDELVLSLWGETQLRKSYTISRDGKIYDDKVGLLIISGKTIEETKKYLISQFGRIYATLTGSNPSTYMDVSLGQLRSINVNFVGEVKYPGIYPVHPFSTAITGLIQAGGVDTTGSLRNVIIKRGLEEVISLDFYDYLLKGELPENIQLRDRDVIIVPPRISTVKIDSIILRPGIYESIPGATISQLIDYAGGLLPNSSLAIALKRITPFALRDSIKLNIQNYYINYSNSNLALVQDGDQITVRSIFNNVSQVEIIGQVKKPGLYYYYPGMNLNDLIKLGGGFRDTTFLKSVYQSRAELVRRNPNTRYESVIKVNLKEVLKSNSYEPFLLQNLDRFVVHANLNFFEKENVQILGEINVPGSYPLILDNETLGSLLERAGGLTGKALDNGISIYRNKKYGEGGLSKQPIREQQLYNRRTAELMNEGVDLGGGEFNNFKLLNSENEWIRVAWKNKDVTLMPGDSVVIKEATKTVNIDGEVYNPGLIEYQEGKGLKYYINSAGGITKLGDKNDMVVIYANGVVVPKKFMSSPKIMDGATIIVNQKQEEVPFNLTEFASTTLSIVSTTVTILVLSQQLSSN